MTLPSLPILGTVFGLSELCLSLARRSKSDFTSKDRNTLGLIWTVVLASVVIGSLLSFVLPAWPLPLRGQLYVAGFFLFALGLVLRWFSIVYLGRFFTVNVAIAADHKLIESGPFRWMRHPSYTGMLLIVLGIGLCAGNFTSLLIIVVPSVCVCFWRIRIEEEALMSAFGEQYRAYMKRTKRLVPLIY
jgi:protein-S-isoprenylcysteine O-methyltransferase